MVDEAGAIRDLACREEDLDRDLDDPQSWIGRPWVDTVTVESRPKVAALMRDAAAQAAPRWRHLNQVARNGSDVPILYSAIKVGDDGGTVVFGRDLRGMSALQQRLVQAQQSLEQDYARLRHVEMRYRLLFQTSAEAIVILEGTNGRIAEANPAAQFLLAPATVPPAAGGRVMGRPLAQFFDPAGAASVQTMIAAAHAAGRAEELRVRLGISSDQPGPEIALSASLFREDGAVLLLVRLGSGPAQSPAPPASRARAALFKLMEDAPDGYVVTDTDGRVITANAAFLGLANLASEEQARGETLDRWLGRQGVDLDVLLASLRHRGIVRMFATAMRGEYGGHADVEVSAVSLTSGGQACFGFAIRDVGRRMSAEAASPAPGSVDHLTDLVGRVPLKELVRQSSDVIERMCIEAALRMTNDNRASAAEMLGLSRQSFYAKLRRYGLGDLPGDDSQ